MTHGKKLRRLLAALVSTLAVAGAAPVKYEGTNEDFPNPERGFYVQRSFPPRAGRGPGALDVEDLRAAREKQLSLVRMLYSLRDYREAPIPEEVLATLAADFDRARTAGVKVIPRFSYSSAIGQLDASVERILSHIEQLKPALRANADVIAFFEAGFAGAWGEWHSSTNGLFDAGPDLPWSHVNAKTRAIVDKLLEVLPRDRMIAVRCPRFKWDLFGEEPLSVKEGFDGSPKARTGAINDCFLATANDMGTYTKRMAEEKAFLHRDNLFVPQGGETCSVNPPAQPFIGCENALKEMDYLRYSTLNIEYHRKVLAGWDEGGCMPEIRRRMGYRFRLVEASIPESVKPGTALRMSFTIENDGWANLYNPRPVEIVLRHKATGALYALSLAEDARLWMPFETRRVEVEGGIPAAAAAGDCDVLLRLPDAAQSLRGRPEYAVRLANTGVWEPATGMNSLLRTVALDPKAKGARYSGARWFK